VNRFFKRHGEGDLERRLRNERPEPSAELMRALSERMAAEPVARRPRRARLAVSGIAFAAVVAAFGAFGGIGYAANAAKSVVVATKTAVVAPVQVKQSSTQPGASNNVVSSNNEGNKGSDEHGNKGDDDGDDDSSGEEYGHKKHLCHKPGPHEQTLSVDSNAVPAHLDHGDYLGYCHHHHHHDDD
jgi:hypothetical protein